MKFAKYYQAVKEFIVRPDRKIDYVIFAVVIVGCSIPFWVFSPAVGVYCMILFLVAYGVGHSSGRDVFRLTDTDLKRLSDQE